MDTHRAGDRPHRRPHSQAGVTRLGSSEGKSTRLKSEGSPVRFGLEAPIGLWRNGKRGGFKTR